jgi:NADPH-dependent 2,4-dienoyl-CoA reductase/sulfur reductase-like enzyme
MGATQHYNYLIVGGGMTADAAVRGIRESDRSGTIGLIGAEAEGPYNRPPLTKGLWKGKAVDKIWRGTPARGVEMHLGCRAVALDPDAKTVTDHEDNVYGYDRLLLATGGTPRTLPFGGRDVIYYRTLDDYRRLRGLADRGQHFVVIGAGFIGTEIAAALVSIHKQVTMVFPEECIGIRVFPRDLAEFVQSYYQQKGVEVLAGHSISAVCHHAEDEFQLDLQDGSGSPRQLLANGIVAGLGIEPNVELARMAGLDLDNGIVVDEGLRTSAPDIYAAGDVASFYNPALDRRMRVEHEDNANTMGQLAGRAMAGQVVRYTHLPFFYSDMFDLGYEAVGELDPRLETFADWQEPYHKGVVYYLRDGRVRGVLLWNVWSQLDQARALIAEPGPLDAGLLKGRLPRG